METTLQKLQRKKKANPLRWSMLQRKRCYLVSYILITCAFPSLTMCIADWRGTKLIALQHGQDTRSTINIKLPMPDEIYELVKIWNNRNQHLQYVYFNIYNIDRLTTDSVICKLAVVSRCPWWHHHLRQKRRNRPTNSLRCGLSMANSQWTCCIRESESIFPCRRLWEYVLHLEW